MTTCCLVHALALILLCHGKKPMRCVAHLPIRLSRRLTANGHLKAATEPFYLLAPRLLTRGHIGMNELRIPQWYLALASTLHLNIVFPIAMVLGSVVAGLTLTEAMSGFLAGTLAFTFLMLAYTLNKGMGVATSSHALYLRCACSWRCQNTTIIIRDWPTSLFSLSRASSYCSSNYHCSLCVSYRSVT